jgi:hypothetical protein
MAPSSANTSGLSVTGLAAQAVRVLHAVVALFVALADGAVGQQRAVVARHVDLPRLAAQRVDARVKRPVAAARGVHRQRAHHQCALEHRLEGEQRMQRQRGAGLRAVDQCQALLGRQLQRRDAEARQGRGRGLAAAVSAQEEALAHQRQRHVRQRCQVATGTDAALAGHIGHEAGVVHRQQAVDDRRPNAAVPSPEAGCLQRQHQPQHRRRQRRTHAHAVAADQVPLQRGEVFAADARGRQLAETGVDAVHRRVARCSRLHHGRAGADAGQGLRVQQQRHHPVIRAGVDGLQFFEREFARAQQHRGQPFT